MRRAPVDDVGRARRRRPRPSRSIDFRDHPLGHDALLHEASMLGLRLISLISVPSSRRSRRMPGTSVRRMSFSAPRAMAMSAAAVSAFTLYDLGSPPIPPGDRGDDGHDSRRTARPRAELAFTLRISPTRPRGLGPATVSRSADRSPPSRPQSPRALPPARWMRLDELLVHLAGEDHLHDFHGLLVGIAQAVDEDGLLAQAAQHRVYLRARRHARGPCVCRRRS